MDTFETFIEQHHGIIYKICRVYASHADFDDLYQEVLISLWKSRPGFKGESKESTWVYRVTLNTALTYSRDGKSRNRKLDTIRHETEIRSEEPEEDGPVRTTEQLYAAISQLEKEDRSIILLYLEQYTYDEISEITGLTITHVGVKINRIKKKLFQLLNAGEPQ